MMSGLPVLSDQTARALENAGRLVARDQALIGLRDLLDPDHRLSTWALAGEISGHLRRFQSEAYARIKAGHREPRNALEAAMLACCNCCPTSQTKLHPLLCDLRLGA